MLHSMYIYIYLSLYGSFSSSDLPWAPWAPGVGLLQQADGVFGKAIDPRRDRLRAPCQAQMGDFHRDFT